MTSNPTSPKTLVAVVGATATGKTAVSIALAQAFGSEIISADSRQIYRETSIGTAAPTAEERSAVPHHFIATRSVTEDYSCGQYETEAIACLESLFQQHDTLFLVGGSGLYVDAVCRGLDALPPIDTDLRQSLTARLAAEGLESLLAELKHLDPTYYAQVDRNNPQRVMRALEVCLQTGLSYSLLRSGEAKPRPFRVLKLGIRLPRAELYARINLRVDQMIEQGLEAEARALYPLRSCNALQTVGYREFFDFFGGTISREEAIERIKRNSRRYAKRQETWFLKDQSIHWIGGGAECVGEAKKVIHAELSNS